jgi:hypothetical protein
VGSGTQLQESFVTSSMMTPEVWDALAEAIGWMRRNADVLIDSHGIGGDPARGEVYGYASWSPRMGILALRNPSDAPASFSVDLGEAFELPENAATRYVLSEPWSKPTKNSPVTVEAGTPYTFRLAPFEVLVLDAYPANRQ